MSGVKHQKQEDGDKVRVHGYGRLSWAIQVRQENNQHEPVNNGLDAHHNRRFRIFCFLVGGKHVAPDQLDNMKSGPELIFIIAYLQDQHIRPSCKTFSNTYKVEALEYFL